MLLQGLALQTDIIRNILNIFNNVILKNIAQDALFNMDYLWNTES